MKTTLELFTPVFDNADGTPPADDKGTPPVKTFTQDEVNALLAKEKRETLSKAEKRIKELEAIRDSANLKGEQLDALNKQIEDMQNEHKTKEQLKAEELQKFKKESETKINSLTSERETWKGKYTNMVIENAIVGASVENEAFDPDQIVAILRQNATLVETLDENGKPTGVLEPRVKFVGVDDEGKDVELNIHPKETVKRMAEMDKYANLFKRAAKQGLGAVGGSKTPAKMDLKNIANYKKYRESQRKNK